MKSMLLSGQRLRVSQTGRYYLKLLNSQNDLSKLGKLVLQLRGDKLDSEQLVLVTERTDQPKITDFFKPVSPKVHELATKRDRVQGLERRLKEAELLKSRLEKENDNHHAKNAEWRKKSRPDSAADSSIPRTTKASGVKAKSKKLEDRITNPNTPVKDSPPKPKTGSNHRRKSSGNETKQSSKTKL